MLTVRTESDIQDAIATLPDGTVCAAIAPQPTIELDARYHEAVDGLEVGMMQHQAVELPLVHRFTPGLYIREIFMPAGTLLTSKIHKTEHPYTISKGRVRVLTEESGWVELRAPHTGVTKPGTRRVLYILEDTIWTTYHPTTLTDLGEIEDALIEKHDAHRSGLVQPPMPAALEGAIHEP